MEEKSYSQMKQEFREFYFSEIKPRLPKFNEERRKGTPKIILWNIITYSFVISFLGSFFVGPITLILIPIPIIASIILLFLNIRDRTTIIKSDYEIDLKRPLMNKFLGIFLENVIWKKDSSGNNSSSNITTLPESEYLEIIKKIKEQNIIKIFSTILLFDDIVNGKYKEVSLSLYEANSNLLKSKMLPKILLSGGFIAIFLGAFATPIILIVAHSSTLIFGVQYVLYIALGITVLLLVFLPIFVAIFVYKYFNKYSFKGIIVEFDMNKKFSGHTFFHENSFTAKKIPFDKKIYQKVNLESTTFEDKYNVYSDNQVEARYILTPALMERIENLKFAFKAKYVRGSFKDNKLTLAIHTGKDMFAMGSDFKDSDAHTFEILYDEMISILQIVDELKLNERTGP